MHRQRARQLIDDYELRHREEREAIERFRRFVDSEVRCFERDCWAGHVTGSAWVVNAPGSHVLLTHHRKLDRWLQLGGHSDGDPDTLAVAQREAEEESGLRVVALADTVFDLDIHEIPARRQDPAHYHFDLRFCFEVVGSEDFKVSSESHDLAWAPIAQLSEFTDETSMLRMARKWLARD